MGFVRMDEVPSLFWYYTIAEDLNTPIEALLSPPVVPLVTNCTNKLDHF